MNKELVLWLAILVFVIAIFFFIQSDYFKRPYMTYEKCCSKFDFKICKTMEYSPESDMCRNKSCLEAKGNNKSCYFEPKD